MNISFKDLRPGQSARVTGFVRDIGDHAYRKKLLAMGLTRGAEFQVIRLAPLGDPVEISLRGFHLSLRKDEAAALKIELD